MGLKGLKIGAIHPFEHPKCSKIISGKTHFAPMFDPILENWPIFKAFWDLTGAKLAEIRPKMGSSHLIVQPKCSGFHF